MTTSAGAHGTAFRTYDHAAQRSMLAIAAIPARLAAEGAGKLGAEAAEHYPKLAGKIQAHHVTPKYLGGAANGPTVDLDAAYHQLITNEFRRLAPYGGARPSPERLQEIMRQVYSKYPLP